MNIIEDVFIENKEKGRDFYLFKRLMKYAKGYVLHIFASFILLALVVGVELLQPVLVAKGIDGIITKYNVPYTIINEENEELFENVIHFNGKTLIKDPINKDRNSLKARVIIINDSYYFVEGLTAEEIDILIDKESEGLEIINNKLMIKNKEFNLLKLNENDLKILRSEDFKNLIKFSFLFAFVILLGSVVQYVQALLLQYTGQKIIYKIRMDVYSHIQQMEIDFFNNQPIGKLVTRVTNDTETLNEMYTSVIINSVKNIFVLIGIIIVMIGFNLRLSLLTYSVIPVLIIATIVFRKYSKVIFREVRENLAKVNAFLSEHISGMKIIQVFAKEEQKYKEFVNISGKLNKSYKNQITAFSIYGPTIYFLRIIATSIIIFFGGKYVISGVITIGTLVAFTQYISRFFHPVQQLAEQFNVFQSAMASAERIFGLLDRESNLKVDENSIDLENIKGDIEFKNVWFKYKDDEWILKDVSFKVNAGETVAFVGATGAGKTTILTLIGRYYDIQKGDILIDGINIKKINPRSLRKFIGQMLQDVFIFTGDIESNIKLRDENIRKEDVINASKYVNADKFIDKLPKKYKERVYERGSTLSAGQRQLLSFARTLVRKPSILILDEATANIDTETEKLIQDALIKIMKGRTTLAVAHRLSTVQHSDKIIVMHKGRIKEIGNHNQLLQKKGLYYNLVKLQYQE